MFATCMPGLSPLVSRELTSLPGITVTDTGFDGRADFVLFEADRGRRHAALSLRTTDDVFVEVGRTLRSDGDNARWISDRIWRPERVQRALSVWAEEVRPLASSMTFRVIARVLHEGSFLRTDLRNQMSQVIRSDKPKWKIDDPSQMEVWISEYQPGRLVAGLRLTDVRMRQHDGREVERQGALRPTVAAAMVALAREPSGLLLDPCCGSGTILAEALAKGWKAEGIDIDPSAVDIAQKNVPAASVHLGDARKLDREESSVSACVSNLPFGQQFTIQGDMTDWLRAVLGEMARVTMPGGWVVLLAPTIPRNVVPAALTMRDKYPLQLLGTKTSIWTFERI